uniref:C2H2-type domain-containing protein n=1 Tax=Glossina brevipalpis TaxID=37001 RepID=A0A1A9WWT9_9MUSC
MSSDESTATRVSLVSNRSEKLNKRKWNQREYELIGDFLLNLYHRRLTTKNKHEFTVLKKDETTKEFLTFLQTAEVKEKFQKLNGINNLDSLLRSTCFVVESSDKSPFYKLKSSNLIRYRKNKLEKLDKLRINSDVIDGPANNSIADSNNAEPEDQVDETSQMYQLEYQGSTMQKRDDDFYLTNSGCCICQENFESMSVFEEHVQKHSDDSDFEFLNSLSKFEPPIFSMHYRLCKDSHKLCVTFTSSSKDDLVIEKIILVQTRSMIYMNNLKIPYDMPVQGYDSFYVDSQLFALHVEHPIVLVGHLKESKEIRIVEEHHLTICHELPPVNFNYNPNHISKSKTFKTNSVLPFYLPSKKTEEALADDFFRGALMKISKDFQEYIKNDKILQLPTYVPSLRILLQIEDVDTTKEYNKLTQQNVVLQSSGDEYSLKLNNKNTFIENILSPVDNIILTGKKKKYYGIITAINVNRISFRSEKGTIPIKEADGKMKAKYTAVFHPCRFSIRYQYQALELLSGNISKFEKFLFPSNIEPRPAAKLSLDLYNKHIKHNPEQLQAVCNIVEGPRRDATYIIFGPPGTGKTTTVVEAILQLLKKDNTKILVTASSNAACDEVASRLCRAIESLHLKRAIVRIYARSYEKRIDLIDDVLLDNSNMYQSHFFPCVEAIHEYRIVVCTLSIVAKLATGGFGEGFTHIFIDEVAACTETEALLAVVNIAKDETRLIISGDHKQLGPILQSNRAEDLGLGASLMDRLMERDCYRCNNDTGDYDRSIQTRLRFNFRSHPEIVNLFSGMYYNHTLEAKSKLSDVDLAKKWHKTPNDKYPIIFHSVRGFCDRDRQSVSLFNLVELGVVMDYVKDLMYYGINGEPVNQTDIGIISPYKKQYQCIQEQLNLRKWYKIETGAVESFQGREKPIIIVSFVRSRTETLGFLNNPRRLNVTISRAKSLLILIGNPQTLSMNADFAHIIDMCRRHESFRGEEFKRNPNKSFVKSMQDLTLEEQQQFGLKKTTNYRRRRRPIANKNNARVAKSEENGIEQFNNNNGTTTKRHPLRQRQRRNSNTNGEGDRLNQAAPLKNQSLSKPMKKQNKPKIANIENLFNELPMVPKTTNTVANTATYASKGMNSAASSVPHSSHIQPTPQFNFNNSLVNPISVCMTNDNKNFNKLGHISQMPPIGNASSQMQHMYNGISQTRPMYNGPSQTRPMYNGPSQTQPMYNGISQTRPMYNGSLQMHPMYNGPSQTRPKFNGPSQMHPMYNGPSFSNAYNHPFPHSLLTVNNSNFNNSSIPPNMTHPSMLGNISNDNKANLNFSKDVTTVGGNAARHQTSEKGDQQCKQNYKYTRNSRPLTKTTAKQSAKQSVSPILDKSKNDKKTANLNCERTVADTSTTLNSSRQTTISTTSRSEQNKPKLSTASMPVKPDTLTGVSNTHSNTNSSNSSVNSVAIPNRPLNVSATSSSGITKTNTTNKSVSHRPSMSNTADTDTPTTNWRSSGFSAAVTSSPQLISNRQSFSVDITTSSPSGTTVNNSISHRPSISSTPTTNWRNSVSGKTHLSPIGYTQSSPIGVTARSTSGNISNDSFHYRAASTANSTVIPTTNVRYSTSVSSSSQHFGNNGRTFNASTRREKSTKKDTGCNIS